MENITDNITSINGLTINEVEDRVKRKLTNKVKIKSEQTYLGIIIKNTFTFYNMLLMLVTVCFIIAEVEITKYSFLIYAVINLLISLIQEFKSKRTIDKLKLITSPKAIVLRNNIEEEILAEEIVLDDVIKLQISDQIPADAIVVSGRISCNESMLTGESNTIKKYDGDRLLAGSYCVSGECYAKVTAVGIKTYANQLQLKTKQIKAKKSKLMSSITTIIKTIGFLILPIALLNYAKTLSWGKFGLFLTDSKEFIQAIRSSGSLVIGMIPSGLVLLTSTSLAVGVIRLFKHNTLVQDLGSIESLSRVDTLCLDKTGTITDGTMSVEEIMRYDIKITELHSIMSSYLKAVNSNNQTNCALVEKFSLSDKYKPSKVLPFSSETKYSAVQFENKDIYVLGAPEYLIDPAKNEDIFTEIADQTSLGYRVVMLCKGNKKTEIDQDKGLCKNGKLIPLASIVIKENIRKDAKKTLDWFHKNGIEIKIISGDNPVNVSKMAAMAGVINADKCISLDGMPDEELCNIVDKFTVFGRVSPDQKALIVETLQKKYNKKVGFIGDGVNDILALRKAECSITVASGSDAVKNVAQLVLLDDNFASLPAVVFEGRRNINNIQLTSTLFLMKTLFCMITALFSVVALPSYEFRTENFVIIQSFCIGIPSIILALQPSKAPIKGNFLKNVVLSSVPAALLLVLPVLIVYLFNAFNIVSDETKIPLSVLLLNISAYAVLFRLCKPFGKNTTKKVMFISMVLLGFAMIMIVPDLMLVPDYLENKNLTEILKYILDSFITCLKFDIFTTSIFKYFGLPEYIFMASVLLLSFPLYKILSLIVSHTIEKIEIMNPDLLNDDDEKPGILHRIIKKRNKKRSI